VPSLCPGAGQGGEGSKAYTLPKQYVMWVGGGTLRRKKIRMNGRTKREQKRKRGGISP